MIWKLEQLQARNREQARINNKWVPVRPINYKYRSLREKIKESYMVFIGKADLLIWPEGQ